MNSFRFEFRSWTIIAAMAFVVILALFYNGRHSELYVLSAISALITMIAALVSAGNTRVTAGPAGCLLFALVGWSALTIAWSEIPYASIMDLGALGTGAIFYAVWRLLPENSRIGKTQTLMVGGGLLFATSMLGQSLLGYTPRAMLVNPNSAAGFLNLLWPAAALAYIQAPRHGRQATALIVGLAVMLVAMNLPGSRGALLGAFVALTIIAAVGITIFRTPVRVVTVTATFVFATAATELLGGDILAGLGRMSSPMLEGTSRITIWRGAWDMLGEHPWLGYGPGVFWLAYDAYRLPTDGSSGFYVHNDLLQYWIERGIPGALLLVAIGLACCWAFYRAIRRSREPRSTASAVALVTMAFAALAATAAHSMFTFSLHLLPFLTVCGILLAWIDEVSIPCLRFTIPDFRQSITAKACLLLFALPIGHFALIGLSFSYSDTGSRQVASNEYNAAANSFRTARAFWSRPDVTWYLQANVNVEALRATDNLDDRQIRRLVTEASDLLDSAQRRNPHRSTTHLIRGLLRSDHPQLTKGSAIEAFKTALDIDPRNIEARYSLSQILERQGNVADARGTIEHGLELSYSRSTDLTPLSTRAAELRLLNPE